MGTRFYVLITLVITLSAYAGLLIFTDGGKDAGALSFLFPDLTPNSKVTEPTAPGTGNKPAQPNPPASAPPPPNPPETQAGTNQPAKAEQQSKPSAPH